jgi:hypothetical protein
VLWLVKFGLLFAMATVLRVTRLIRSVLPIAVAGFPDWRFHTMQGNVKEHWMELCEKATVEQDSEKLMALIQEINRMLEKKEDRLRRKQNDER